MTTYIAAYDTEAESCLDGVRRIVEVHEKHEMPATFFIVARLLDEQAGEYRALLADNPLFEIACHTYTHMLVRDHHLCGPAGPADQYPRELLESKKRIEDVFGRAVTGFRTPCGFPDGLKGAPRILELLQQGGYSYSSSLAWGPWWTLPALILESFRYEEQGYPDIWEIPPCGWMENVLKGHNPKEAWPLQLFPHPFPEAMRAAPVQTVAEEVELNRLFIDKACRMGVGHVSLIWHPWSLHRFDPDTSMLDRTFAYVHELGLKTRTFEQHCEVLTSHGCTTTTGESCHSERSEESEAVRKDGDPSASS